MNNLVLKKIGLLFSIILFAKMSFSYDIKKIRADYIESIENSEKADAFYKQLNAIKKPDALLMAYLGSAQAIRAKHAWNPVNKLSYIKQGFNTINKAVSLDPNHLEVRFLRFSLEYYVPAFLGYSKNQTEDKNKIIDLIKRQELSTMKVDKKILKDMVLFMETSKKCTTEEIAMLKKAIA